MTTNETTKKQNRWLVVLGALPIQLCLGAVYAWSVFRVPLQEQFGWSSMQATIPFQVILIIFAFSMIAGGLWQDRSGPRLVASVGGLALGLGLFLASKTQSVFMLSLTYGVIGGFGIGLAYGCPIASALKWFPDKRGLITGLIITGFGGGAMIFAPIARMLIDANGVQNTFAVLGIVFTIGVIGGAQFLKNPPVGYRPQGWEPKVSVRAAGVDFRWVEMTKTFQLHMLCFLYSLGCAAGFVVIAHAAPMAQLKVDSLRKLMEAGNTTEAKALGALAVSILAIFNSAGRILWGFVSDRFTRLHTLAIMFLICAVGLLAVSYAHSFITFVASISIVGLCFGGFLAIFPAITAEFFGMKNIGLNYGTVFTAYGVGALIGPFAAARALDTTGDYQIALYIVAGLCVLGASFTFLVTVPRLKTALVR